MREINAFVDLDFGSRGKSERSRTEIAEAINRNAGCFLESRHQKSRSEMRQMMLDVVDPRAQRNLVDAFERFIHG